MRWRIFALGFSIRRHAKNFFHSPSAASLCRAPSMPLKPLVKVIYSNRMFD